MEWERQKAYEFKRGKAEGEQEGKQEKAVETARNFLQKGISPELIAECTGLLLEEVQKLLRIALLTLLLSLLAMLLK